MGALIDPLLKDSQDHGRIRQAVTVRDVQIRDDLSLLRSNVIGHLSSGSIINIIGQSGKRLHYTLVTGHGPQQGWLTDAPWFAPALAPVPVEARDEIQNDVRAMPEEISTSTKLSTFPTATSQHVEDNAGQAVPKLQSKPFEDTEEVSAATPAGHRYSVESGELMWHGRAVPHWAYDLRLVSKGRPHHFDADVVGPAVVWAFICLAVRVIAWFLTPLAALVTTLPVSFYVASAIGVIATLLVCEFRALRYSIVPHVSLAHDGLFVISLRALRVCKKDEIHLTFSAWLAKMGLTSTIAHWTLLSNAITVGSGLRAAIGGAALSYRTVAAIIAWATGFAGPVYACAASIPRRRGVKYDKLRLDNKEQVDDLIYPTLLAKETDHGTALQALATACGMTSVYSPYVSYALAPGNDVHDPSRSYVVVFKNFVNLFVFTLFLNLSSLLLLQVHEVLKSGAHTMFILSILLNAGKAAFEIEDALHKTSTFRLQIIRKLADRDPRIRFNDPEPQRDDPEDHQEAVEEQIDNLEGALRARQ